MHVNLQRKQAQSKRKLKKGEEGKKTEKERETRGRNKKNKTSRTKIGRRGRRATNRKRGMKGYFHEQRNPVFHPKNSQETMEEGPWIQNLQFLEHTLQQNPSLKTTLSKVS